jgi:hypothetical protein
LSVNRELGQHVPGDVAIMGHLLRSEYRLHDKFRSVGARTWRKRGTASHRNDRGTYEKRVRDGRTEGRGTWQHKDA